MTKPLHGKIALVTGGSRGIGAATVERLAADGAHVIFTFSKSKDQADALAQKIKAAGGVAEAIQADAEKPDNMVVLAKHILSAKGHVDILVNNAGVWSMGPIGQIPQVEFRRVMHVNVESVFTLTNELAPSMPKGGRIINISSTLGERAAMAGISTYVASKFAVVGLTRAWAKDLGPKGITVNAVLPGPVDTEMNPANGPYAEYQKANTALGRYGTAEEVAAAIAFLARDDASNITGSLLGADGGWNA